MMKHVAERFVKSIDLNDHGTLFAGQGSSWMVEASFLSAGAAVKGEHQIVCRCIKNLEFLLPIPLGTLIHMESEITKVGTTSIQVHCEAVGVLNPDKVYIRSDIIFVTTDRDGKKVPHHLADK